MTMSSFRPSRHWRRLKQQENVLCRPLCKTLKSPAPPLPKRANHPMSPARPTDARSEAGHIPAKIAFGPLTPPNGGGSCSVSRAPGARACYANSRFIVVAPGQDKPTLLFHPKLSAMRTRLDKLVACIFVMTLARWISTVRSARPSSSATALFERPRTIPSNT